MRKLIKDALEMSQHLKDLQSKLSLFEKQSKSSKVKSKAAAAKPKPVLKPKPAQQEDFLVCRKILKDSKTQELKEPVIPEDWKSMVFVPCRKDSVDAPSVMFIGKVMEEAAAEALAGRETVYVYRISIPKASMVPYKSLMFSRKDQSTSQTKKVLVPTKRMISDPQDAPQNATVRVHSSSSLREFVEKNILKLESFLEAEKVISPKRNFPVGSEERTRDVMIGIMNYARA